MAVGEIRRRGQVMIVNALKLLHNLEDNTKQFFFVLVVDHYRILKFTYLHPEDISDFWVRCDSANDDVGVHR